MSSTGSPRYTSYARDTPRALYGTECTSVSRISTTTTASRHRTCVSCHRTCRHDVPHSHTSRTRTLCRQAHQPDQGPGWARGQRGGGALESERRTAARTTQGGHRSDFVETCSPERDVRMCLQVVKPYSAAGLGPVFIVLLWRCSTHVPPRLFIGFLHVVTCMSASPSPRSRFTCIFYFERVTMAETTLNARA